MSSSSGTVCVACKVTNGLNLGDGVIIRGPTAQLPMHGGNPDRIGGFVFTENVPKDVWDNWFNSHQDMDLVKRGMIFVRPTIVEARNQALALRGSRPGFTSVSR